jgi:nuclear pore complex protein Nup93
MDNFKGLLQESRRLATRASGTSSNLPQLQKSLDLIQTGSRRLQDAVEPNPSASGHLLDPRTTFLLAAQGFDPQRLASSLEDIQLANTLESLEPVADTDLDAFLRNEHDSMISLAIQESRVAAMQDALDSFETSMLDDWSRASSKVLEELSSGSTTRGGMSIVLS